MSRFKPKKIDFDTEPIMDSHDPERNKHPDFDKNKITADWLCTHKREHYEDIFINSLANRLEISWDDRKGRKWCNPISFNQNATTFKNQCSNILFNLSREI